VGPIWSFQIVHAVSAYSGVELKRDNKFFQLALRQAPQIALRQIGATALESRGPGATPAGHFFATYAP
jgi:hypothetical protein